MSNLHLVDITAKDLKSEPIRKGFGRGLKAAGDLNANVVACCADLTDSTQMSLFRDAFPDRFVEIGVAEQNLVTVGSGLAAMGKIPFVSSYAAFSPGRNWEQIRTTICLNDQPVKVVGSHAGEVPFAQGVAYSGTKAALHAMAEAAIHDLRYRGIRVCCLSLGAIANRPKANDEWKMHTTDVGQLVVSLSELPERVMPAYVEMRPSMPRKSPISGMDMLQYI